MIGYTKGTTMTLRFLTMGWTYNGKPITEISDISRYYWIYIQNNKSPNGEYYIGKNPYIQKERYHHLKVIKEKEKW